MHACKLAFQKKERKTPQEKPNSKKKGSSSSPYYPPPSRHRLKRHPRREPFHVAARKPLVQVLALGHIERAQLMAAVHDGLDPDARDPHASTDGQFQQLQQMEPDAAERGVADGAAAEREVEATEMGTTEREDLGGCIG